MSEVNPGVKAFLERLYQGTFEDLEEFGKFVGAASVEPFQLGHDGDGGEHLIVEVRLREISTPLPMFRVVLRAEAGGAGWTFDPRSSSAGFTDAATDLHRTP